MRVSCSATCRTHICNSVSPALMAFSRGDLPRRLSRVTELKAPQGLFKCRCAMTWHVQYHKDATDHIVRYPSPERAIEAACRLIDDGCDVYGVGTGPLSDSIEREQIVRIYAMWARVKFPFGRISD
jgi:hypothetical protein